MSCLKEKREKAREEQEYFDDLYGDMCDDRFAFIAGYTSGGAPYGIAWEEMGIDPDLSFKEKVELLGRTITNLCFARSIVKLFFVGSVGRTDIRTVMSVRTIHAKT